MYTYVCMYVGVYTHAYAHIRRLCSGSPRRRGARRSPGREARQSPDINNNNNSSTTTNNTNNNNDCNDDNDDNSVMMVIV